MPVATTVVAWPTVQHGPSAATPWTAPAMQELEVQSALEPHACVESSLQTLLAAGPLPARTQPSPLRSVYSADVWPVVGLRMKKKSVTGVSVPSLNVPSLSGQLASAATQVMEWTGTSTCVWTLPVTPVAFPPRVVSMLPAVSAPAPPAVVTQPVPRVPHSLSAGSLVSPTRLMSGCGSVEVASQTVAAPSAPPLSQPIAVTDDVNWSAGMQKTGTVKPPDGTMPVCLQSASPEPTSMTVCTFAGNGKAGSVETARMPSLLVVSIRVASQHTG